ncbi:cell filamentation protein Fic [Lysinibacillus sp. 2017]|uniref:Fic family protein n=1 Tax=unclassified Lysinibacillus TaxID=2636778 RepID=UPI000D527383|nr:MULTISPECIES: Fic family protein [unclassified Lysinibacillus]AWE06023.1 cell filamentation protein Fic [Lysinibacillus sp. 2017]TGN34806.1 Fic family protein [Lysinibacillus sp. S2017]
MLEQIDIKKQQLDAKRPLPKYTVQSLREKLFLEWTYNSNAIEGNTLTINETKVVLEGITVGGKTMREHLEVINHRDAISYVEDIVHKEESFSDWQIKNLHRLILKGIDDNYAGVYRDQQVFISGAVHTPPPPFKIQEHMDSLMSWYDGEAQCLHPIVRSVMLHAIFVSIHPFIDGNGRTSRLLLNLELMKSGYPSIIIRVENRLAYYNALDKAHTTKDYDDFVELVAKEVEASLDLYLSAI